MQRRSRVCVVFKRMADSRLESLSPILSAFLDDVAEICEFLLCLLNEDLSKNAELAANVRSAKTGAISVVRKALEQEEWWKKLEAKCRQDALAQASLGPEVRECLAKLQSRAGGADRETLKNLPTWMDQLRKNITEKVLQALEANWVAELADAKQQLREEFTEEHKAAMLISSPSCRRLFPPFTPSTFPKRDLEHTPGG